MKRALIIASAVLVLTSCAKEIDTVEVSENGAVQTITVNVAPFGDQTKTAVTPTGTFTWSAGDQIGIYPVNTTLGAGQTSQQIVFKINTAAESSSANFTGTGWGLITGGSYSYFSYYPYNASAKYNEVPVSYSDNLNQTANESTAHLGACDYLYAPQITPTDAASASFSFKHLSALVEFELTVPDSVKTKEFYRMTVTASEPVFTTSGKYNPSIADSLTIPTITDNVYTDNIQLMLNNGVGFQPDSDGKLHLFFLMAPAATNGKTLTIKLYESNNTVYENVSTAGRDIASNGNVRFARTMSFKDVSTAIDLSANGTANCYIVPENGKYKFRANVKGNGYDPLDTENHSADTALNMSGCTAAVIWETVNTATAPEVGTIVSNATIQGDYIIFDATGTEGNALIALKKGDDILWSWHIWSTCVDLDASAKELPNDAGYLMDRNLGALSCSSDNYLSCGLMYQWGRPFPFAGMCDQSPHIFATTNNTVTYLSTSSTVGTLEYSAAHPTVLITGSISWLYDAEVNNTAAPDLWGENNIKTMYDPCPIGWKLPLGGNNSVMNRAGFSSATCEFIFDSTYNKLNGAVFNSSVYIPSTGSGLSVYGTNIYLYGCNGAGVCWYCNRNNNDPRRPNSFGISAAAQTAGDSPRYCYEGEAVRPWHE